jgi:DNA-binding response OmpR family regulator
MDQILIVDDNLANLKNIQLQLSDVYQVLLAKSGAQALQICIQRIPDLILLDVDMPGMSGFETFGLLRELSSAQEIPVLFLTGLTGESDEDFGLGLGARDYIKKPFSKAVLLRRLALQLDIGKRLSKNNSIVFDESKLKSLPEPLTETELKIARLLAKNYTNEEIAGVFHYSVSHVKRFVSQILYKLGIDRRYNIKSYIK